MQIESHESYHLAWMPNAEELNQAICEGFEQVAQDPNRQTHFFFGRYENTYVDIDRIPSLWPLIETALEYAGNILEMSPASLRYGFWFNRMEPGQVTTRHSHEEDDELLSLVYYLRAHENSGNLVLHTSQGVRSITPEAGKFVFFDPALEHEVSKNLSGHRRLSLAMNIGPAESERD